MWWWWLCWASSSALLGFLVVGFFECVGFPVKCAEASWLLEVGFIVFPFIAVITRILLFWVSETYHLAGLVPPF